MTISLFFSDVFDIGPEIIDDYGAFDICLRSDVPLFIDPFLMFGSEREEYQRLHDGMVDYLQFLRKCSAEEQLSVGRLEEWFYFKETKQNWLGFTLMSNRGRGLARKFADVLIANFDEIEPGGQTAAHLERIRLIDSGLGRDGVSDFTTQLIKHYLLQYTQDFAERYLAADLCDHFNVARVQFNYSRRIWEARSFYLPRFENDYVLLTPVEILTKDETWINSDDLHRQALRVVDSCTNAQLRARVDDFIQSRLAKPPRDDGSVPPPPSQREREQAAKDAVTRFPELFDVYIAMKEGDRGEAAIQSLSKVEDIRELFREVSRAISNLYSSTDVFNGAPSTSLEEARARCTAFKQYIENNDGYRMLNRSEGSVADEHEAQLAFGLIWYGSLFDVNREVNNGRGPVDFKVSFGNADKSLVELKLGSNRSLKKNLQHQVAIYEAANRTPNSIKMIVVFTDRDMVRVEGILDELGLSGSENVILVDARRDNKPSASKASSH